MSNVRTYLNRDTLNTFDTKKNAWYTNDLELAIRLLIKVKNNTDTTQCKVSIEPFSITE